MSTVGNLSATDDKRFETGDHPGKFTKLVVFLLFPSSTDVYPYADRQSNLICLLFIFADESIRNLSAADDKRSETDDRSHCSLLETSVDSGKFAKLIVFLLFPSLTYMYPCNKKQL